MSKTEPFVMPELPRRTAVRHAATMYRRPEQDARRPPRSGGPLTSSEDVILETVKLGYRIADEQIAKGQELARRLRGASARADAGDVGDLVDQGLRLARQLAVLLVEVTETTVQGPSLLRDVVKRSAREQPPPDATAAAPASAGPASDPSRRGTAVQTVPIEVQSSRLTRVDLVLYQRLTGTPEVFPLYDERGVPLRDVAFRKDRDGKGYVLSVQVDAKQARGTYRGLAVDEDRNPVGSIVVRIEEASPSAEVPMARGRKQKAPKSRSKKK